MMAFEVECARRNLSVADLVDGRVARNEKAPATWTVFEQIDPAIRIRASKGGGMPDALAPLPIFSAQAWPHGALQVASGSFCRLTDGCQPVSFRHVRT
jgi:hypothetical protein